MPTLSEAKAHLRVDDTADDAYITSLIAAAEDHVAAYLGQPLPDPLPASVRAAVLLLVADLYENREAQVIGTTIAENPTLDRLLHLHRTGLGI